MAVNRYDDTRAWYAISTYSGYEDKVASGLKERIDAHELDGKIFDAIVPKEKSIEIKNGKRKVVDRKIFQGYVLIEMCLSDETWYIVRNTPGVTGFIGNGTQPTPVSEKEIQKSRNAWVLKIQNTTSTTKWARSSPSSTVRSRASKAPSPKSTPKKGRSKSWFPCSARNSRRA